MEANVVLNTKTGTSLIEIKEISKDSLVKRTWIFSTENKLDMINFIFESRTKINHDFVKRFDYPNDGILSRNEIALPEDVLQRASQIYIDPRNAHLFKA